MKIPITIITGPTCCGKTSTAIELAEKIDGEIISCDSVLVYKGMDIGSAKPTKYEQERVKHHLIDVSDVSQKFDVSKYIEHAKKSLADILQRGKQPIIAGGSGFYLKAWFSAVTDNLEIPDEVLRKADEIELQSGDEGLRQALLELDPNAPQCVDILNPRRVKNAYQRCLASGKSAQQLLDDFKKLPCPLGDFERNLTILDFPDEQLFARIQLRTKQMIDDGIVDETKSLLESGILENPSASSAIGYRETIAFIRENKSDLSELQKEIQANTIALVRKQRKFFRNNLK